MCVNYNNRGEVSNGSRNLEESHGVVSVGALRITTNQSHEEAGMMRKMKRQNL